MDTQTGFTLTQASLTHLPVHQDAVLSASSNRAIYFPLRLFI
jgi:hypothetical protein